jgi:hypothetical protein
MLLILVAVMVVLIVGISVFAPRDMEDDPRPSTDNHGPQGAKAAYLTLEALGRKVSRWDKPLSALNDLDAPRTTLVLAEPVYSATDRDALKAELTKFLERGGRVLTTGYQGALLLPEGATAAPEIFSVGLCESTPEGQSELARAGSVEMRNAVRWSAGGPRFRVDQRCSGDGVVVHYAAGQGEAVWWSSADPMTNAELKRDGDLRLLLASVGADRDVVFDEALHSTTETMWSATKGLPLTWLGVQAAALFVLLVLSFSRRRGPVRVPVTLPRSSPVEFATSMGDLYEKAHATSAATEAARRRLLRVVTREAGVPQAMVAQGAEAIAAALQQRLGGDWQRLGEHLRAAEEAAKEPLSGRSSLALVRALSEDTAAVRAAMAPRAASVRQVRVEAAEELEVAGVKE